MQDVLDREMLAQYEKPTMPSSGNRREPQKPFAVINGPWDKKPDMSSDTDFPELGGGSLPSKPPKNVWGAWKR